MATPVPQGIRAERGVEARGIGKAGRQITEGDLPTPGVQARDPGLAVSPNAFGAQIGAAQQQFGQSLGDVAATAKFMADKRQATEDGAFVARAHRELNTKLYETLLEAQTKAESADDFLATVQPLYSSAVQETLSGLKGRYKPSEEALARYEEIAQGMQESYELKAITFENNEKVRAYQREFKEEVNSLAESVAVQGDLGTALQTLDAAATGFQGAFTPSEFAELKDNARATLAIAYVESRLGQNPRAVRDAARGYARTSLSGAVIDQESGGNPDAISPKGAVGLMQVMPDTARQIAAELGDKNFPTDGSNEEVTAYLKREDVNLRYGNHYLAKQLRTFGGDVEAALIAYNGGPGRARQWIKAGRDDSVLPDETAKYYKAVLERADTSAEDDMDLAFRYIDFEDQLRYGDRAESRASAIVSAGLEDELTSIRMTGERAGVLSNDDIAAHPNGEEIFQRMNRERQLYDARQSVALTTPEEDAAVMRSFTPEGEDFAAEAANQEMLRKVLAEKYERLEKGPAGYVLEHSPDLAQQLSEADMTAPGELDNLTRQLMEEQRRMGVPAPRALSNAQRGQILATFQAAGPDKRAALLGTMAATFGDLWPVVSSELDFGGAWNVVADMTHPGQTRARAILAESAGRDRKELETVVGKVNADAVESTILLEMGPFLATLRMQGGVSTAVEYQNAANLLALGYTTQGMNPTEAARRAAGDIALDYYQIEDTYRVPHPVPMGNVRATQRKILRELPDMELETPPSLDTRMQPDQLQEAYKAAVLDEHYWITNADESGLVLMDEIGEPVTRADGTVVHLLFDDLVTGYEGTGSVADDMGIQRPGPR